MQKYNTTLAGNDNNVWKHKLTGAANANPADFADRLGEEVVELMAGHGIPMEATRDEAEVGGGLFKKGDIIPMVDFRFSDHPAYIGFNVGLQKTGPVMAIDCITHGTASPAYRRAHPTGPRVKANGFIGIVADIAHDARLSRERAEVEIEETYYATFLECLSQAVDGWTH